MFFIFLGIYLKIFFPAFGRIGFYIKIFKIFLGIYLKISLISTLLQHLGRNLKLIQYSLKILDTVVKKIQFQIPSQFKKIQTILSQFVVNSSFRFLPISRVFSTSSRYRKFCRNFIQNMSVNVLNAFLVQI